MWPTRPYSQVSVTMFRGRRSPFVQYPRCIGMWEPLPQMPDMAPTTSPAPDAIHYLPLMLLTSSGNQGHLFKHLRTCPLLPPPVLTSSCTLLKCCCVSFRFVFLTGVLVFIGVSLVAMFYKACVHVCTEDEAGLFLCFHSLSHNSKESLVLLGFHDITSNHRQIGVSVNL